MHCKDPLQSPMFSCCVCTQRILKYMLMWPICLSFHLQSMRFVTSLRSLVWSWCLKDRLHAYSYGLSFHNWPLSICILILCMIWSRDTISFFFHMDNWNIYNNTFIYVYLTSLSLPYLSVIPFCRISTYLFYQLSIVLYIPTEFRKIFGRMNSSPILILHTFLPIFAFYISIWNFASTFRVL